MSALDEYLIAGIKTTLPFFRWLIEQPAFRDGTFHTTYLDEILALRNGEPFAEAAPEIEDIAAIAAALQAALSSDGASDDGARRGAGPPSDPSLSSWRAQARAEALR